MTRTKMPDLKTSKRHAEILCRRLVFHRALQSSPQVIAGDPACERCKRWRATDWAHIIPRRYSVTRCDPFNAWALCRSECHATVDQDPMEKVRMIERTIGVELYDEMNKRAQAGLAAVSVSPRAFWLETRTNLIKQCEAAGLPTTWR